MLWVGAFEPKSGLQVEPAGGFRMSKRFIAGHRICGLQSDQSKTYGPTDVSPELHRVLFDFGLHIESLDHGTEYDL